MDSLLYLLIVLFVVSGSLVALLTVHLRNSIREKRQARTTLAIYNDIFDKISIGVIVVDHFGAIVYLNKYALVFSDCHNSEPRNFTGKPIDQLFNHFSAIISNLFSMAEAHQAIVLENGVSVDIVVRPLRDSGGAIIGRIIEILDITERKQVEEQLKLQSYALEAAASGIMITDSSGRIQWVNQSFSEITGFSREDAIGKTPQIQRSGLQSKEFYASMWETLKSGRSWRGEIINRRFDGSIYTEEQTIAPVKNPDGSIGYYISVKQDISERKQLEQLRDDLIQTIVHDLRNPLTAILMSLDLIQKINKSNGALTKDQQDFLDTARFNTKRMADLVNAILDINRLENERIQISLVNINLNRLVTDAIKFQMTLAAQKNITINNYVDAESVEVMVDIALIGRVLQNLFDNAIKFTPNGGQIQILSERLPESGWCRVSVNNSGSVIPEDVRTKLFQKFASGSNPGHGTGLGLAYCRLAIEAHGGEIWADTEISSGTTVNFTLPMGAHI